MKTDLLGYENENTGQKLPRLSRSNLKVLPPLKDQITTSVVLSSIGVFHDVDAVGDPNVRRKPKISDWMEQVETRFDIPEVRRRRYSVDCTTFGLETDVSKDPKKLQVDLCTTFREQSDQFRRGYNDKILLQHPFWRRFENTIPDADGEEFTARNLFLETANASIHNPSYKAISKTGIQGWLHDETIDLSFDVLERLLKSENYGIAISNTTLAQELFVIGEHYLAALEQPDLVEQCYKAPRFSDELLAKLHNIDYLTFPINDGYVARLDAERLLQAKAFSRVGANSKGTHWSVMVVDCRGSTLSAVYLDSLRNNIRNGMSRNMQVARCLLLGLKLVEAKLSDTTTSIDPATMTFTIDPNTPSQRHDNESGIEEHISACGPFVFLIVKEIVQFIVECHEERKKDSIGPLSLPRGYAARLKWDSKHTRQALRGLLDRERRTREWLNGTAAWLDVLPQPGNLTGWQTWLRNRQLDPRYFWDPRLRPVELGSRFSR
jgi:hypothetical protein